MISIMKIKLLIVNVNNTQSLVYKLVFLVIYLKNVLTLKLLIFLKLKNSYVIFSYKFKILYYSLLFKIYK